MKHHLRAQKYTFKEGFLSLKYFFFLETFYLLERQNGRDRVRLILQLQVHSLNSYKMQAQAGMKPGLPCGWQRSQH